MLKNSLYILSVLFFLACESDRIGDDKEHILNGWNKNASTNLNKKFVLQEQMEIQSYLKRRPDWEMLPTGTGLQYWIYKDTVGEKAKDGDIARVHFEIKLLDGTVAYTSKDEKPHRFRIAKSNVETGIQEGIKYLSIGDKAKMIIPSHIGHGLVGDFDKIPPLQVLIVDIELVALNQ